ncbi:MAG TPA: WYL domain-containing protein [Steroidobacteraceae bacterium]|nr:WYL domain-containing protein [Steroidobacteraceae bacterium]
MDRTERFYRIYGLLQQRKSVTREQFLEELGISPATFKRDLEYLRDRMNAPIDWSRETNGYQLARASDGGTWQLPGIWFNAAEIHALLTLEHLLETLQPGLLAKQIHPLRERIEKLLGSGDHSAAEVRRRIRILPMAARSVKPQHFEVVATAVLARRRLTIRHYNRQTGVHSERVISPQRLVHYRYNWYVDAWCHLRRALRTFSLDAIESAALGTGHAREIPDATLDRVLSAGYGIFAGRHVQHAVLQFTPLRARWVANEVWHPQQKGSFQLDGSWILELPYSDERELVMEILKYGADVRVLAPDTLRQRVAESLRLGSRQYE